MDVGSCYAQIEAVSRFYSPGIFYECNYIYCSSFESTNYIFLWRKGLDQLDFYFDVFLTAK